MALIVAYKIEGGYAELQHVKGKQYWLDIVRYIVGHFKVFDEHVRAKEPNNIDEEAQLKRPLLQLQHLGRLIGNDTKQLLFLDFEVVTNLFYYLIAVAEQRTYFLTLC